MRIAINTRLLLKNKLEGIGWFTYQTLQRLTNQNLKHEFIFFFDRPYDKEFVFALNVHAVTLFPPARHPLLWYWYFENSIPRALNKYKPDVYVSTDGWTTLKDHGIPTVNVIHDINFEHHPEFIQHKAQRWYYKNYAHKYAQNATRIATVSEYTKHDIIQTYNIDADKIDVVYNGVNDCFKPISEQEKITVRQIHSQGNPYFLYVGSLHKRKNIVNMLKAFEVYKERMNDNMKFLLVGTKMWDTYDIDLQLLQMKYRDDVIFYNHFNPIELNAVLSAAEALIYVSLFEGFGVPIVEAFASETPVITSNVTSMPEIANDAAIYCTPQNHESIAEAMTRLMKNPALRTQLVARGVERRKLYSWDITAQKLWDSINKAVK